MCGFMSVLCRYFCLCYVHFVLLVLCAVFLLVDCARYSLRSSRALRARLDRSTSPTVYHVIVQYVKGCLLAPLAARAGEVLQHMS